VLSGHIHLAESLSFDEMSGRAPQLISGKSGTALDEVQTASPTAAELRDSAVTEAETLSLFGFMTLEPDEDEWSLTQRDRQGTGVLDCDLVLDQLTCEPPEGR